jgi:phosphotransferase system HPr (HPr) family protein
MVETKIVVKHKVGLHARPASIFVQTANKFTSEITVRNLTIGGDPVDAKSILMVLTLGVVQDHEIQLRAEGPDEQNAIQCLRELVLNNFGEAG